MSDAFINAVPKVIPLGTKDSSTRSIPIDPIQIPQHLPKFLLYAQKGPTTPQIGTGSDLINIFGSKTFDPTSTYFNHASIFATTCMATGNRILVQRVIPTDAGPEANINVYLDIQHTMIPVYGRNSDGSYIKDVNGELIPTSDPAVPGYIAKWVVDHEDTASELNTNWGTLTTSAGTIGVGASWVGGNITGALGDPSSHTTASIKYPIFQLKGSSIGSDGNNKGFRIWAPTNNTVSAMPSKLMHTDKVYPYFISMISRLTGNDSSTAVQTILGDQFISVVLKPGTIDPDTVEQLYIGDKLLNSYQSISDPSYPDIYGNFSALHIYQDNINTILNAFATAEISSGLETWHDFLSSISSDEKYLFNFISGVTSNNSGYKSFKLLNALDAGGTGSIILSNQTDIYAKGGFDGTMNDSNFATLVSQEMTRYDDPNDPIQDIARNPESWFYDTGFPIETKYDLCYFIARRKNTFLVLTTYQVGEPQLDVNGELSTGIALKSHLSLFPESEYFGTPTTRASIVGFNGTLLNSNYHKRVPLSIELLINTAKYMGAGNGKWKNGFSFDGAPGSIIKNVVNLNVTNITGLAKEKFWKNGIMWAQPYDTKSMFFPAFKTVYDNDTSVLNSYMVGAALCTLDTIAQQAWREFSGISSLTDAQLVKNVNDFITNKVDGIFDNKFVVIPNTTITGMDALRGYSWTTQIKLYAPNMNTVMSTYVEAFRLDDLTTTP